jgi:hypothetical protein
LRRLVSDSGGDMLSGCYFSQSFCKKLDSILKTPYFS